MKHQAPTRPDDHGAQPKLILIDVDHEVLIMKEGSWVADNEYLQTVIVLSEVCPMSATFRCAPGGG